MEAMRRLKERQREGGGKDDRRNSNVSLKQSESISMFVLLSAGSLNSGERCPGLNLCVQAFRGFWGCGLRGGGEAVREDVGWIVFAFGVCMLAQTVTQVCAHVKDSPSVLSVR